jgi:uncharacterized protein (TIGR03000 family)
MRLGGSCLVLSVLSVVTALAWAPACPAQVILYGGRITIGGPTDNEVSTGFGNYPGGNGFVPGYGYAPDYSRNWPTLREALEAKRAGGHGPAGVAGYVAGRDSARLLTAPPVLTEPAAPDASAVLQVRVPADAEVWFSGNPTTQRGDFRPFVTPPLPSGRSCRYEIRARWAENGTVIDRTQTVRVHPGDRLTVDFVPPAE